MVQPAVVPGENTVHAKIRIAGDEVADLGAEAQPWQPGLEVEPAAELSRPCLSWSLN